MKKVLIYSIFRNSSSKLDQYYFQLKKIVLSFPEIEFYLSLYENDSTDDTKQKLKSFDFSFVKDYSLITENLNTQAFGSVKEEQRVINLANARNKAIHSKDFLEKVDWVMMLESDARYEVSAVEKILNFQDRNNLPNVDIVSAIMFKSNKMKHYDKWATRRTALEEDGTLFDDWRETPYSKYYSTCNGICLFKAEAIRQGANYGWYNERLEKFDCDTVVICEKFHQQGLHDIYIDHTAHCFHN